MLFEAEKAFFLISWEINGYGIKYTYNSLASISLQSVIEKIIFTPKSITGYRGIEVGRDL